MTCCSELATASDLSVGLVVGRKQHNFVRVL